MAENKKSFVLYSDQRTLIELLNNEQAGVLLKHIFAYVNDENPICTDQLINIAFEPIKQQFKRDLIKWERTKEGRSKAGLASAEAKKLNKLQQTSTNVNKVKQSSTKSTVNDNVNVNVNNIKDINTKPIDFERLLEYINKSFGRKFLKINDNVKAKFKARIKEGYKIENIKDCIDNLKNNQYHKDNGFQYCTPEFISRSETLDKYSIKTIETKLSNEDEYVANVMKQLNQIKNDTK
jgi:uncharacterized phage protein (TIGR02220 family)